MGRHATHEREVPELPGWLFIYDHPVAKDVMAYELGRLRLARYHDNDGAFPMGQLAVMRLYLGDLGSAAEADSGSRWRAWIIAVRCVDPETELPLTGEPDARILWLLRRFDTWSRARKPGELQRHAKAIRDHREKMKHEAFMASMDRNIGIAARNARTQQLSIAGNGRAYFPDKGDTPA